MDKNYEMDVSTCIFQIYLFIIKKKPDLETIYIVIRRNLNISFTFFIAYHI